MLAEMIVRDKVPVRFPPTESAGYAIPRRFRKVSCIMRRRQRSSYSGVRRGANGFTLLLPVVAIIVVITGLLLPAIARSRSLASRGAYQGNLQQLATTLELYAGDNAGMIVQNYGGLLGRETFTNWIYGNMAALAESTDGKLVSDNRPLFARYLPSAAIYNCPSDRTATVRSNSINSRFNPGGFDDRPRWVKSPNTNQLAFARTNETFLRSLTFGCVDEDTIRLKAGYFAVDLTNTGVLWVRRRRSLYFCDVPAWCHSKGGNLAFPDEHAEAVRWRDALEAGLDCRSYVRIGGTSNDAEWLQSHAVGRAPQDS